MSFFNNRKSSINFDTPDEGGDGLREMIEGEMQEPSAIDLFAPETGEDLEQYLNSALAMGGVALGDSLDRES